MNLITEAWGGLEHLASTVLMTTRWKSRTRKGYLEWLGLASHEFFHAWNVKRLRPMDLALSPTRPRTTRAACGSPRASRRITATCSSTAPASRRRASTWTTSRIRSPNLQTSPGRLVQTLADASFDAWIKHYRPDENTPNTAVSYYTKGAIVAFLLDIEIRRAAAAHERSTTCCGVRTQRYAGERGYTDEQFRALVSEVAGADLGPWLSHAVDSTAELEYGAALEWLGLRFSVDPPTPDQPRKAWLGAVTRNDGGRLVVAQVRRETPASRPGSTSTTRSSPWTARVGRGWDARMEAYVPAIA